MHFLWFSMRFYAHSILCWPLRFCLYFLPMGTRNNSWSWWLTIENWNPVGMLSLQKVLKDEEGTWRFTKQKGIELQHWAWNCADSVDVGSALWGFRTLLIRSTKYYTRNEVVDRHQAASTTRHEGYPICDWLIGGQTGNQSKNLKLQMQQDVSWPVGCYWKHNEAVQSVGRWWKLWNFLCRGHILVRPPCEHLGAQRHQAVWRNVMKLVLFSRASTSKVRWTSNQSQQGHISICTHTQHMIMLYELIICI